MAKIRIKPIYIGVAIILIVLFLPGYAKFMELRAKNLYLENEIERLEQENIALNKEKARLERSEEHTSELQSR